jgi:hypothetical protein
MIHVTIFINATPIRTIKAVNCGPVSPEDLPNGADKDALICRYEVTNERDQHLGEFIHDRADGAIKCAYRMLWNADQWTTKAGTELQAAIEADRAAAGGDDTVGTESSS